VLAHYDAGANMLRKVEKAQVSGIKPRNAEQIFAVDVLTRPSIPLVTLTGKAGTGKTLLALASAVAMRRDYRQIYVARPLVPLSNKDMGYLPGDVESKLAPYMQPIWDNLKVIQNQYTEEDRQYHQIDHPYLDAQSNGLSYLIDHFKGQNLYGHVNLEKGERSELAELASNLL
jgi:PhoH-like ATPase